MNLQEAIRKLPKTDLHCHLDGSIRAETVLDVARREKIDVGSENLAALKKNLVCGEKVSSLPVFLRAFDITCAVLQSREAIERIAFELAEDAAAENVRHLEVRFSPLLMTNRGLSPEDAVLAAVKGLKRAEAEYPIRAGVILCALRVQPLSVSVEVANLAVQLKNKGVVGFDLAHAERGNPARNHAAAFDIARDAGLGITVHAGEDDAPESIRQAIDDCHAVRIGHGRTLYQDPELERRVIREGIAVECCPSSNVQINLTPSFSEHPVKGYLERGVLATLNTDNRLLTGINVTDEYLRAEKALGLSWEQLKTVALNGFKSAFLPESERESAVRKMSEEISRI